MNEMLKSGIEFLAKTLLANTSDSVDVYRDGTKLGSYSAILARSEFDDVDNTGRRSTVYVVDFLFKTSTGYVPKKTDKIVCSGSTYVVRPITNELWRYDDPYRIVTRVHAQQETS